MLETFCTAANVKVLMQQPDAPKVLKEAEEILKRCCIPYGGQGLITDMNILAGTESDVQWSIEGNGHMTSIPDELQFAWAEMGGAKPLRQITVYKRYSTGGIHYVTRRHSHRDCYVFFAPTGQAKCVPGVIEYIFSTPLPGNEHSHFAAIRRNLPVPEEIVDPFRGYEDFGTQLWGSEHELDLEIITLGNEPLYHAIMMPWEDSILAMKLLDKVSSVQAVDNKC